MGKRKRARQSPLWIASDDLPRPAAHPFYQRLNTLLRDHGFDDVTESECARYYRPRLGRPSLAPGVYFRLLLIGYFEGIDSERGIAWRVADSLTLRDFIGIDLHEGPPDHSTISRTRRLIAVETHQAVFTWVLQRLTEHGLLTGQTLGVDATTLEANAAMRSIVRRDTGETYQAFLTTLAQASGIETPTRQDLARLDRKRKKKTPNTDWTNPHDPDARITKMKDGRTHLAHKAEHAVDLESGAVVAVTIQPADDGDTTTCCATMLAAAIAIETVVEGAVGTQPSEMVADRGYHSNDTLVDFAVVGVRTYIAEPDRGRRNWTDKAEAREAVYANRRRIRGPRGQALLRGRGEKLERSFAHCYETGGMRRTHLRGHPNLLKRILVHVAAFNLGLIMRRALGVGTPRGLQGRLAAVLAIICLLLQGRWRCRWRSGRVHRAGCRSDHSPTCRDHGDRKAGRALRGFTVRSFRPISATGC